MFYFKPNLRKYFLEHNKIIRISYTENNQFSGYSNVKYLYK